MALNILYDSFLTDNTYKEINISSLQLPSTSNMKIMDVYFTFTDGFTYQHPYIYLALGLVVGRSKTITRFDPVTKTWINASGCICISALPGEHLKPLLADYTLYNSGTGALILDAKWFDINGIDITNSINRFILLLSVTA